MNLNDLAILASIRFIDKVMFTKHLYVMLKSGIPLTDSIIILRDQTQNSVFKKILIKIVEDLDNGQTLEKALSKHPLVFNPFFTSLIKIGEQSGTLEANLQYLASHMQKSYEFSNKVQGALLYPAIILISTLLVGGGLSLFVMPSLVDLFKSLDVELPITTKILLFVSEAMRDYGFIIVPSVIAIIILTIILLHTKAVKPHWHKFLLKLPLFGTLFQNIELTSICRNLGIMLKSGMPITQTLESLNQTTNNLVYKEYLKDIQQGVNKGKKLSDVLMDQKMTLMPPIISKMVSVGEKSGTLEDTFIYLGDFFEEEVDNATKNLSTTLEPLLLIIIGLGVAFVALAIISPIYQLTGSIRR